MAGYDDFSGLLGLMQGQGLGQAEAYPEPVQTAAPRVSMGNLLKDNWGLLGTVGVLSALANSGRRRPLGQVIGNAGLDALSALGQVGMAKMQRDRLAQQDALQRSQWEAARADRQLSNAIALGNYQLKQAEAAREAAGYQMLGNIMGGGLGGMPGMGAAVPAAAGAVQPGQGLPTVEGGRGHSIAEDFHNPGNIKNPATHNAADRRSQFRRYASDAEGFQDMARLLGTKGYQGLTVRQMANRWVTGNPGSSAPAEYLNNFVKMGFNLDAPANISDQKVLGRLLKAFAVGESPLGARYSAEQIQGFLSPGSAPSAGASPVPAGSPLAPPSASGQDMSRVPRMGAGAGAGLQPLGIDPRLLVAASFPGNAGAAARAIINIQMQAQNRDLQNKIAATNLDMGAMNLRMKEHQIERDRLRDERERMKDDPRYLYRAAAAKNDAAYADKLREDIATQDSVIENAATLDSLYAQGLKTGIGQDVLDNANRFLNLLGIDGAAMFGANRPQTAEAFRQMTQTNVFNVLKQQTGVQTEGDAQRAARTWASIGNTPQGNQWINAYMRNVAQRKKDRALFIIDYMDQHGGGRAAAEQEWRKRAQSLPSVVPAVPGAPGQPAQRQAPQQAPAGRKPLGDIWGGGR